MTATAIKERPIIFTADSVRAILDGRKTQTRRVVKGELKPFEEGWSLDGKPPRLLREDWCPYGQAGDRLWAKEAFVVAYPAGPKGKWSVLRANDVEESDRRVFFRADGDDPPDEPQRPWKSPLFMRRGDSRITLEITDIRVERVQKISAGDVFAEGFPRGIYRHAIKGFHPCDDGDEAMLPDGRVFKAVAAFAEVWDEINCLRSKGEYGWNANPWVWAITFKTLQGATA